MRRLGSRGELRDVLQDIFAIDIAGLSGLDAVLNRSLSTSRDA